MLNLLSLKYTSSNGQVFDLLTDEQFITECNAFDFAYKPVTFGKKYGSKIYGFEMEQKEFDGTLYFFGGNRINKMNELFAAFEYDIRNETPGTLVCNNYSIDCYCIEASDASINSSNLNWDSVKRKFLCPYPLWSKETGGATFFNSASQIDFEDVKDYYPGSSDGTADYPYDYMTNYYKTSSFTNDNVLSSDFKIRIMLPPNGEPVVNPVIWIKDMQIALELTINEGEILTIDNRSKSVMLTDSNGAEHNRYGYRDVAVDIFKRIEPGVNQVEWNGNFIWDITLFDERTAPPWN